MNDQSDPTSRTRIVLPGLSGVESLKHFRIERLIGEGGMGRVYRAHDTQLHRSVAVKLLSAELTADSQRKQRFLQEARAAARISHPAIAQIYNVDEEGGVIFIVMELVEGKTVGELIQTRRIDLLGAIEIAIHVAEALAKAHELGVVHRDIKPANVMMTADGHVKVLDFGLAKLLTNEPCKDGAGISSDSPVTQTQSGVVIGTPAYMSPEQVRGVPVESRADIFSLGALLFEMATGQSPFRRDTFMDTLHAVAFEEAPQMKSVRSHIPDELQRIVSRCLKKSADERYPNARLLVEDLKRLRRDTEAGVAQKTSWRQRIQEAWEQFRQLPPSHYKWHALAAIVLALALYWSLSRIGTGGVIFLALAGFVIYRGIRNRPHRVQDQFVRRVAKIPEVRLVVIRGQEVTVVVLNPVAQLYGRINALLRSCNRKLYFGQPMTVSILHQISEEQFQKLLTGPGVQFFRDPAAENI